jgi:hypothetical protein
MQGATKAHRDEPERLIAATHPPRGIVVQVEPPLRVVTSAPPLFSQPTVAVGNTIVGVAVAE